MTLSSPSLAYSRNPAPFICAVSILGLRGGLSAATEPAAGFRNTLKRMPLLALFLSFPLLSNIPAPGLSVLQDHRFIASKKDYISFSPRLSIPWIRFFSFFFSATLAFPDPRHAALRRNAVKSITHRLFCQHLVIRFLCFFNYFFKRTFLKEII